MHLILALAVTFNPDIRHGILDEEVYIARSKGFVAVKHPDFVSKLHKSNYGLKQTPRVWFNRLPIALLSLGFLSSQLDPSLFTYHLGSVHAFLLIHVDDILVTSNDLSFIISLISNLQEDFSMKDLGNLSYFLGIEPPVIKLACIFVKLNILSISWRGQDDRCSSLSCSMCFWIQALQV